MSWPWPSLVPAMRPEKRYPKRCPNDIRTMPALPPPPPKRAAGHLERAAEQIALLSTFCHRTRVPPHSRARTCACTRACACACAGACARMC
eukprot:15048875-Alexandrium_andersonii.AAC.1